MKTSSRVLSDTERAEIIAQSAVVFFLIFLLTYVLPDEEFRRAAGPVLTVFTVSRVLLKFAILIPYKETVAAGGD